MDFKDLYAFDQFFVREFGIDYHFSRKNRISNKHFHSVVKYIEESFDSLLRKKQVTSDDLLNNFKNKSKELAREIREDASFLLKRPFDKEPNMETIPPLTIQDITRFVSSLIEKSQVELMLSCSYQATDDVKAYTYLMNLLIERMDNLTLANFNIRNSNLKPFIQRIREIDTEYTATDKQFLVLDYYILKHFHFSFHFKNRYELRDHEGFYVKQIILKKLKEHVINKHQVEAVEFFTEFEKREDEERREIKLKMETIIFDEFNDGKYATPNEMISFIKENGSKIFVDVKNLTFQHLSSDFLLLSSNRNYVKAAKLIMDINLRKEAMVTKTHLLEFEKQGSITSSLGEIVGVIISDYNDIKAIEK
jgi:hypothetical protein